MPRATCRSRWSTTSSCSTTFRPTLTLDLPAGLGGIEATNAAGEVVNFGATAFDDVHGPTPVTCVPSSGSKFALGTTTVTCSAADGPAILLPGSDPPRYTNDKVGTAQFTVTVKDTTVPVVTVPGDIAAEASSIAGRVITYTASAYDLVSGAITPACAPVSGATFAIGATTVTCSATDGAGNRGSASFKVTVKDTTPPPFIINGKPVSAENPLPSITKEASGPYGRDRHVFHAGRRGQRLAARHRGVRAGLGHAVPARRHGRHLHRDRCGGEPGHGELHRHGERFHGARAQAVG